MRISTGTSRVLWTVGEFLTVQIVTLITIVVLARLITPAEFGIVAVLALFTGIATIIVDSGLGQALIQRQKIDDVDKSTAFWISIVLSLIASSLFFILAKPISEFYNIPQLEKLIPVYALTIIGSSAGVVPRALLIKAYRTRAWGAVRLLSSIFSGFIAIMLASLEFGVFSLAWQSLSVAALTSVFSLFAAGWKPRLLFSLDSARWMYKFSGHLLLSGVLEVFYARLNTVLLGKVYGPETLGYFNRAENISSLISGVTSYPLIQLALPSFSEVSSDIKTLKRKFLFALRISSLFSAVLMLTAASLAEPLVLVLLGPAWSQSVYLVSILCLSTVLMPVHILNLNLIASIGRTDIYFRIELAKKVVGILILLTFFNWGVVGLAHGYILYSIAAFFINSWPVRRILDTGPLCQLLEVLPGLAIGVISAGSSLAYTILAKDSAAFPSLLLGAVCSFVSFLITMAGFYAVLGRIRFLEKFAGR